MWFTIRQEGRYERFANIVKSLKELNNLVNFSFYQDKLYIQLMDSARISILEVTFTSEWFDEYNYDAPETTTIVGLDSDVLYRVLSTKQPGQTFTFRYENGGDEIDVVFENDKANADVSGEITEAMEAMTLGDEANQPKEKRKRRNKTYEKQFILKMYDIENATLDIPFKEQQAMFVMESQEFSKVIDQMALFSELVTISIQDEFINFITNDEQTGTSCIKVSYDDVEEIDAEDCDEGSTLLENTYVIKYLKMFCHFAKVVPLISVGLTNESPICTSIDLQEGSILRLFVAPKIND